jgi:Leucine-rich repeat (LRR) protein
MLFSLPPGLERLEDLKVFNLEGNRIEYLPDAYGRMTSLVSLNLGRNRLTLLPDSLCTLVSRS